MGFIVVLGIIVFLLMEHAVAFWLVFVPLGLLFIFFWAGLLWGNSEPIGNITCILLVFIMMIIALVIVAS